MAACFEKLVGVGWRKLLRRKTVTEIIDQDDGFALWEVDLEAATATHRTGFMASFQLIPQTDVQIKAAEAAGMTGLGVCCTQDGREFAAMAAAAQLRKYFDELEKRFGTNKAHLVVERLAQEAGKAFIFAQEKRRH